MYDLNRIYPQSKKFTDDVNRIKFPFGLIDPLIAVVNELRDKKFKYKKLSGDVEALFTFEKGTKERILIGITSEHLMIRHFELIKGARHLRVVHVIKPTDRRFKLLFTTEK